MLVGEILVGEMQVGEKTWSVKLKVGEILGHPLKRLKIRIFSIRVMQTFLRLGNMSTRFLT